MYFYSIYTPIPLHMYVHTYITLLVTLCSISSVFLYFVLVKLIPQFILIAAWLLGDGITRPLALAVRGS